VSRVFFLTNILNTIQKRSIRILALKIFLERPAAEEAVSSPCRHHETPAIMQLLGSGY
jgi:hypothetical protein